MDLGEAVPLGIVVRDVDEARTPINAGSVTVQVTLPDQTVVTLPVGAPAATGYYTADYVTTQVGRHLYRWATTAPTRVLEGSFEVLPPWSAGLLSLTEAKELLRIDAGEDRYDERIRNTVMAATAAAENERKETIARRAVVETRLVVQPCYRLALGHRPVLAVTSVERVNGGVPLWIPPAIEVDEHGIVTCLAGGPFYGHLRVRYVAGYAAVPAAYREALGYIVQHLWANRQGSSSRPRVGGQSGSADDGGGMGYSIPNRARDLLGRAGPLVG